MHLHKPTIFYGLDSNHPSHGSLWPGFPCWGTSSRPGRLKIHWFVSAADPNVSICYASEIDGEIGCFRDGCGHQAGSMFQTPACKVNLQVDLFWEWCNSHMACAVYSARISCRFPWSSWGRGIMDVLPQGSEKDLDRWHEASVNGGRMLQKLFRGS